MILIEDALVSDDLYLVHFVCSLDHCKGACCVEGDAGAPLTEEEISQFEDHIDIIKSYMTERGILEIEGTGVFDYEAKGDFVTPLVNGLECAFTNFKEDIAFCAIERAFEEGKVNFRKPVSCHLYPIRIDKLKECDAVNYHKWVICKKALKTGKTQGVPLYQFCKEALIRQYNAEWYQKLESEIQASER